LGIDGNVERRGLHFLGPQIRALMRRSRKVLAALHGNLSAINTSLCVFLIASAVSGFGGGPKDFVTEADGDSRTFKAAYYPAFFRIRTRCGLSGSYNTSIAYEFLEVACAVHRPMSQQRSPLRYRCSRKQQQVYSSQLLQQQQITPCKFSDALCIGLCPSSDPHYSIDAAETSSGFTVLTSCNSNRFLIEISTTLRKFDNPPFLIFPFNFFCLGLTN
jgi:hypothetical protein